MKRKLVLLLLALPVVAVSLGGCIIEERGGGYYGHPHYYHDRW